MTTANKITILRILLIPFFVVEVLYYIKSGNEAHRLSAILSFAIAAILDGVDGYIARTYNQRSELGAILDPLADKLLLVSGIVVLSFEHSPFQQYLVTLPLWLAGTIIGRDVVILAGMFVIQMTVGKVQVRPRIVGKVATVLQMVVVLWALLQWDSKWLRIWVFAAAICTGISGLLYIWDGSRQLSAHPASSAKREP
jgi:cardiolipin synthase